MHLDDTVKQFILDVEELLQLLDGVSLPPHLKNRQEHLLNQAKALLSSDPPAEDGDGEYADANDTPSLRPKSSSVTALGVNQPQEKRISPASSSSNVGDNDDTHLPDVSVSSLESPEKSGYLEKRRPDGSIMGKMLSSVVPYQKRFCVLHKGIIYYFDSPTSKKQKGAFVIGDYEARAAVQSVKDTSKNEACFELVSLGKRTYQFVAKDFDDMISWIDAIGKCSSVLHPNVATIQRPTSHSTASATHVPDSHMSKIKSVFKRKESTLSVKDPTDEEYCDPSNSPPSQKPAKQMPPSSPDEPDDYCYTEDDGTPQKGPQARKMSDSEEAYGDGVADVTPSCKRQEEQEEPTEIYDEGQAEQEVYAEGSAEIPNPPQDIYEDVSDLQAPVPPPVTRLPKVPPAAQEDSFKETKGTAMPARPTPPVATPTPPPGRRPLPQEPGSTRPLPPQPSPEATRPLPAKPSGDMIKTITLNDADYCNMFYGLWDCLATKDHELSFKSGDILHVLDREHDSRGWWTAILDGHVGLVPKQYLTAAYALACVH